MLACGRIIAARSIGGECELPQAKFQTVQSLGSEVRTLKPKTSNIIAGGIISAMMIAGGLALAWWTIRQTSAPAAGSPRHVGDTLGSIGLVLFGFLLALAGCFVAWGMRGLASFALTICKDGFYCADRKSVSVFGYADIVRVDEMVVHERIPTIRAVTDKVTREITSYCYEVHRCDGKRFYIDGNNLPRTSLLSGPLKKAKVTHGFQWHRRDVS